MMTGQEVETSMSPELEPCVSCTISLCTGQRAAVLGI